MKSLKNNKTRVWTIISMWSLSLALTVSNIIELNILSSIITVFFIVPYIHTPRVDIKSASEAFSKLMFRITILFFYIVGIFYMEEIRSYLTLLFWAFMFIEAEGSYYLYKKYDEEIF